MAAAGLNKRKAIIQPVIFLYHCRPISVIEDAAASGHTPTSTTRSTERMSTMASCTTMPMMARTDKRMMRPGPAVATRPAKLPSWVSAWVGVALPAAWSRIQVENASPAAERSEMVATPAPMVNNVVSIPVAASLAASGLRSMARRPAATSNPRTAAAATYQLRLLWRKPTVPEVDERLGDGTLTHAERSNFSISPSAEENSLAIEFRMPPLTAPVAALAAPLPTEQIGPATTHTVESTDITHLPTGRSRPERTRSVGWENRCRRLGAPVANRCYPRRRSVC